VMIGEVDNSSLGRVIVAAEEVSFGVNAHIAGRDRNVRVPAQVVGGIGSVGREQARRL
jgi:hypothetical protein